MKPLPLSTLALTVWTCLALPVVAREFTDSKGRKLEADIVTASQGQVTLKRATDGQTFTVPATMFSAEDQKFIQDFAATNMQYKFEVRSTKVKLDEVKTRDGNVTVEKEKWAYKLDIKNLSSGAVPDLRVDYWCFRRRDDGKGRGMPEKEIAGSHKLESMVRGGSAQFKTLGVEISKQLLDANFYWANGDKSKQADGMGGVVLRFFSGPREVFTYATKDDLLPLATGSTKPETGN